MGPRARPHGYRQGAPLASGPDDLRRRPRNGRILLDGRWIRFPLRPADLVKRLPPSFALGALNAIAVAGLRIPTLIATLGTRGIITGAMLVWVGSKVIPDYPPGLDGLSTNYLVTAHSAAGNTRLSVLIVPAVVICILVALMLRFTMVGRR